MMILASAQNVVVEQKQILRITWMMNYIVMNASKNLPQHANIVATEFGIEMRVIMKKKIYIIVNIVIRDKGGMTYRTWK